MSALQILLIRPPPALWEQGAMEINSAYPAGGGLCGLLTPTPTRTPTLTPTLTSTPTLTPTLTAPPGLIPASGLSPTCCAHNNT
ncbi:hypothetical protein CesoFtcFv8_003090 [Champsocephalus esox]|uniref:Uncharacterized protein n=1 Tax=Champsocephalus esox TaxID=159716 RepID=A0AAN8CRY2_9TELE|nr:hypothetical protein CesoFtcFv8_003090 [Champsocephalus esox]